MGCLGLWGILMKSASGHLAEEVSLSMPQALWLLIPLAFGLVEALGLFAVGKAFLHPNTSTFVVIMSTNPVVVLVLTAFINQKVPNFQQLLGMGIVLLSVSLFSAMGSLQAEEQVAVNGEKASERLKKFSVTKLVRKLTFSVETPRQADAEEAA